MNWTDGSATNGWPKAQASDWPEWARPEMRCEVLLDEYGWVQGTISRLSPVSIEVELDDDASSLVMVNKPEEIRPLRQRFDVQAEAVAARLRATGRGFLTMRKDELRDAFGVGRFTEGQSNAVCEALSRFGVFVFPAPYISGPTLRLYEAKHPVADVVEAVLAPDNVPETSLRRAADAFARERAGQELRSDDAPWLTIFDLFLQLLIGRQPEGWEDLRDDRHPSQVARELAEALGINPGLAADDSAVRIAAAVSAFRPRHRRWTASELVPKEWDASAAAPLISKLQDTNSKLRDEHEQLLQRAAQLLLGSQRVPDHPVEVGLLGLRYRRENDDRSLG